MDAPVPKLSDILRHPDELDKIPTLKLEFTRKKGAVDAQLRNGLRDQIETAQSGLAGLADGQKTVQAVKDEMARIDRLCSESQNMIRGFAAINVVSQAQRNFGAVEAMRRNLETFGERLAEVEQMLRQNEEDLDQMPALLPCHFELTRLRNIRDDAMEQIRRADDASLQSTLEDYLDRLDDAVGWFDRHVGQLAANLIELVVGGDHGLVVRFAAVIEAEDRSDQRVLALQEAMRDHRDMATRFRSITDAGGARTVRGYRDMFVRAIRLGPESRFADARVQFLDDPSRLDKAVRWFFNELNAVKVGMSPLVPRRWRVLQTYANTYHALMHDFLVDLVDDPETSSAHMLEIVAFPERYYQKMARLGLRPDELAPHVVDQREPELVRDFRDLIVRSLDEWIGRIFDQEKRDFATRTVDGSNLDQDEYGYFRSRNLVATWRMLREQIDAAASSKRTDVVEGVVDAMLLRMRSRQQDWQRMLEGEVARFVETAGSAARNLAAAAAAGSTGSADSGGGGGTGAGALAGSDLESFQSLQDWLVAAANDQVSCLDDNDDEGRLAYLSSFRQKLEPSVSAQYRERADVEVAALRDVFIDFSTWCLTQFASLIFAVDFGAVMADFFTSRWYGSTAMRQIVVTFEEYVADYRQVLHHSLVDVFVQIFADELLVRYLGSVRNRGVRLRRADPFHDKVFNDVSTAVEYFGTRAGGGAGAAISSDTAEAIVQTWRATEHFLNLLTCDRDAVADRFADFKQAYWDLHISWVEAVLRSRDDFERGMLNAVKARAVQMEVVRGAETIMAKVK